MYMQSSSHSDEALIEEGGERVLGDPVRYLAAPRRDVRPAAKFERSMAVGASCRLNLSNALLRA